MSFDFSNDIFRYKSSYKFIIFIVAFFLLSTFILYYLFELKELDRSNMNTMKEFSKEYEFLAKSNSGNEFEYLNKYVSVASKLGYIVVVLDSKKRTIISRNIEKNMINSIIENPLFISSFMINNEEYKIYYTSISATQKLIFFPFIQFLILFIFIGIIYGSFKFIQKSEKNLLWAAMAKESAHQLGTPITSLEGWRDYLTSLGKESVEIKNVAEGIDEDIERIKLVTERFSKIAVKPNMAFYNIEEIIYENIEILFNSNFSGNIYMNKILFEWTIENLIKNSIQAIPQEKKGVIEILLYKVKNQVIIDVKDNGIGIKNRDKKAIFKTGFTTKKRGWGLGLSLSKRVVEIYHNGKLYVKKSNQSEGTIMTIELNTLV